MRRGTKISLITDGRTKAASSIITIAPLIPRRLCFFWGLEITVSFTNDQITALVHVRDFCFYRQTYRMKSQLIIVCNSIRYTVKMTPSPEFQKKAAPVAAAAAAATGPKKSKTKSKSDKLPKRHQNTSLKSPGFNMPAIKRMARRGGAKRISKNVLEESNLEIRKLLTAVVENVMVYMVDAKRKTILPEDVMDAAQRHYKSVIGFKRE